MNDKIIKELEINLNIKKDSIINTLKLLEEGSTIPFIARYRKEATSGLDEIQIKEISDAYTYSVNLLKRKEDVIRLIDEKGMLTDELKVKISSCDKLIDVEDLYRPYKEKKKTKALDAINNGLEKLAKIIMSFPNQDPKEIAKNYTESKLDNAIDRLEGAKYIISEWISDNASYRKWIRNYIFKNANIITKIKKSAKDEEKIYEMYYEYIEKVKFIKPHRILAINRAENDGVISVSIDELKDDVLAFLEKNVIKDNNSLCAEFIKTAIEDSYKRLIFPSIEREIRSELTDKANIVSIDNFSNNLGQLLMIPPMKEITVLGFDPAFRTGCKLAVLDKTGKVLDISVIYPHEPKNETEKSKKIILDLIDKYCIDVIAIGNGTASRESEAFIANTLKESNRNTKYIIVSEAGASVYSASTLAIKEFPNLDVAQRSAISIGRRLQDPLSELVKIDPKSIGVGLYQHDLKQKELDSALTFVIQSIVNKVGVNINTASNSILSYISGLTKKTVDKLIETREKIGKYKSRKEIEKILSNKVYEQAIGFIRINDANNFLDRTKIHPESYEKVDQLLKYLNINFDDIGSENMNLKLKDIDIENIIKEINIDKYTLEDIISSLKEPLRDPRDEFDMPILRSDILTINDLNVGMKLQGTVRNIVDFGAFIDIGLKNDGLIHISEITNKYIKHPSEVLKTGDIIDCYVKEILKEKNKVSLTMKNLT